MTGRGVSRRSRWLSGRRKGFISFILAAVFLFALIPAAALVSSQKPDLSFENFRAMQAKEIALKQAFYQSSKTAATAACISAKIDEAAALASGAALPPGYAADKVKEALLVDANLFESELLTQGYAVSFWCGDSDEWTRKEASAEMVSAKTASRPGIPDFSALGASTPIPALIFTKPQPLGSLCASPFQVDTGVTEITFNKLGFSLYDRGLGMGKAVIFPSSYGVKFDCQ